MIDLRAQPKDCDCVTHEGLHWLHIDRSTFERNLKLIKPGRGRFAWWAFAQEESVRLREKQADMHKYTRDEFEKFIFPDGYRERDYQARVREALADIIPQEQP